MQQRDGRFPGGYMKNPRAKGAGELQYTHITRGKQTAILQPAICPTEYRCYIKEVFPYATAGAVTPSWKISFVHRATPRPDGT